MVEFDLDEFRAIAHNLVPLTEEQIKWTYDIIERFVKKYPWLKSLLKKWMTEPDLDMNTIWKMINWALKSPKPRV